MRKEILKDRQGNGILPITHVNCVIDAPNVISEKVVDEDTLEDFNKVTQEDLKKALFIDLWNQACKYKTVIHGKYNKDTGFFELNGLTDITYEEAIRIYNLPRVRHYSGMGDYTLVVERTCFPVIATDLNFGSSFGMVSTLEVLRILDYYNAYDTLDHLDSLTYEYGYTTMSSSQGFLSTYTGSSPNIKRVLGKVNISGDLATNHFNISFPNLEEFYLKGIKKNIPTAFKDNRVFKMSCWKFMIQKALNTTPITIKVHPNVYSKLMGVQCFNIDEDYVNKGNSEADIKTYIQANHVESWTLNSNGIVKPFTSDDIGKYIYMNLQSSDTKKDYYLIATLSAVKGSSIETTTLYGNTGKFDKVDNIEDWVQLNQDAIAKQITFATT